MKNLKFKIILGFIGLLLIALFIAIKTYNKPHINVLKEDANFKLSSNDLLNEFFINEDNASKKYANKIIEVKGVVQEISTAKGKGIITLKGEESNVICELNESENKNLLQLKKGQNIVVKGQCSGFLLDVMMINCVLFKIN